MKQTGVELPVNLLAMTQAGTAVDRLPLAPVARLPDVSRSALDRLLAEKNPGAGECEAGEWPDD